MKFVDLTGQRFGRLTALSLATIGNAKGRKTRWVCRCDCGNEITVDYSNLACGHTQSCGCLHREIVTQRSTTHGMTGTPEYRTWGSMISRCTNPNEESYKHYGGRGITVCDRWLNSFADFYADMGPRPDGHSIERIDVNGNYEPGNCRWATLPDQHRNKRSSKLVTIDGQQMTVAEAARLLGIPAGTAYWRVNHGRKIV